YVSHLPANHPELAPLAPLALGRPAGPGRRSSGRSTSLGARDPGVRAKLLELVGWRLASKRAK
ncbi:MAG: hypothetical protein WBL92_05895, partial [Methanothrix sp.]